MTPEREARIELGTKVIVLAKMLLAEAGRGRKANRAKICYLEKLLDENHNCLMKG